MFPTTLPKTLPKRTSMPKTTALIAILLCVIVSSCTTTQTTPTNKPEATPAITPKPSPTTEAGGGFAPPETGDTSTEDFAGTVSAVDTKRTGGEVGVLKEVRTGRHEKFDRVVFEFSGAQTPGYRVEYITKPAQTCGAGDSVAVAGQGDLLVQLSPARAHNEQGQPTITQRERQPNLPLLKEMKLICDFEADVQWVLGVMKANPFRVVELTNPARLVVDIKH